MLPPIELQAPQARHRAAFLAMIDEFRRHGEAPHHQKPLLRADGFDAHLAALQRSEATPGRPPWRPYWAMDAAMGELLGLTALRHTLDAPMAEVGGHIGFQVRPSRRGQGLGRQIFGLTLAQARAHGLERVLVLCAPDNAPSLAVVRRHGGVFEREASAAGQTLLRFWVPTPP